MRGEVAAALVFLSMTNKPTFRAESATVAGGEHCRLRGPLGQRTREKRAMVGVCDGDRGGLGDQQGTTRLVLR